MCRLLGCCPPSGSLSTSHESGVGIREKLCEAFSRLGRRQRPEGAWKSRAILVLKRLRW